MNSTDPQYSSQDLEAHLVWVKVVASRMVRTLGLAKSEYTELFSAGSLGLVEAAENFDESRGYQFRTYAETRVRGAMLDAVRRMGTLSRGSYHYARALRAVQESQEQLLETNEASASVQAKSGIERLGSILEIAAQGALAFRLSVDSQDQLESMQEEENTPETQFEKSQVSKRILLGILKLPKDEQEIVRKMYFEDQNINEVSQDLDHHKSWTSRKHAKILQQLQVSILEANSKSESEIERELEQIRSPQPVQASVEAPKRGRKARSKTKLTTKGKKSAKPGKKSKKAPPPAEKRKRGRPKGARNKMKKQINPKLL